jgi:hypothetical protein
MLYSTVCLNMNMIITVKKYFVHGESLKGARRACTNPLLKLSFCLITNKPPSGTAFADPWEAWFLNGACRYWLFDPTRLTIVQQS